MLRTLRPLKHYNIYRVSKHLTTATMSTSATFTTPTAPPSIVETETNIFFYGHELTLQYSRLQNWYPSVFHPVSNPAIRFYTAEHAIMHAKAVLFSDLATAERILNAATPTEAGRLGREVKNFDSAVWKENVDRVAEEVFFAKFSQVSECREALMATGTKGLAEASPKDKAWGIGFRGDEAEGREGEWGRNIAGRALERVRERLRHVDN